MKTPAKLIFWRFSGVFLLFNFCGRFKKFGRRFFPLIVILRSDGFVFVFRLDFAVCGSFLCVKLFHLPPNVILTYEIFRKRCPTRFPLMKFFARLAQRVFCLWNFSQKLPNEISAYEIFRTARPTCFLLMKFLRTLAKRIFSSWNYFIRCPRHFWLIKISACVFFFHFVFIKL